MHRRKMLQGVALLPLLAPPDAAAWQQLTQFHSDERNR
jgi:hypothetical protein